MARKKLRRLGSPPEEHEKRAVARHSAMRAAADDARNLAARGFCGKALDHLVRAATAAGEVLAERRGAKHENTTGMVEADVDSARSAVLRCLIKNRK